MAVRLAGFFFRLATHYKIANDLGLEPDRIREIGDGVIEIAFVFVSLPAMRVSHHQARALDRCRRGQDALDADHVPLVRHN